MLLLESADRYFNCLTSIIHLGVKTFVIAIIRNGLPSSVVGFSLRLVALNAGEALPIEVNDVRNSFCLHFGSISRSCFHVREF